MTAHDKQSLRVHIRWMIRRDMPEVLDIENDGFEFPWSEEDFIRCLRQRNCIGMVAEHDERVVGFMIYELHKTRLHVLNFAVGQVVAPARRRHADGGQARRQAFAAAPHAHLCWKCARRTWPPSCSSAVRASGPSACCATSTKTRPKTPT